MGGRFAIAARQVFDVSQNVPLAVLRHWYADPQPDSPIRGRSLPACVAADRDTLDQGNAATMHDFVLDFSKPGVERRKREIGFGNFGNLDPGGLDCSDGIIDLVDIRRRQPVHPSIRVIEIAGVPAGRIRHRSHGRCSGVGKIWHRLSPSVRYTVSK